MSETEAVVLALPGLELGTIEAGGAPRLQLIAEGHVRRLAEAGRIDEGHALLVGIILDLARAVGMSSRKGQAAGAALAGRQLLDAIAQLPPLHPEGDGDEFRQLVEALGRASD